MKRGWMLMVLVVILVGAGGVRAVHGQVSAYAEFSLVRMKDAPKGDYLYGGTAGVIVDGPKLFKRIIVSADIDTRLADVSGVQLDGVTVGPRFSVDPIFFKVAPFVGFDIGFARFHDSFAGQSTDNTVGGRAGATRALTSRLDALLEYRYEYYGYSNNLYNPQTISGGVMYHFTRR